MSDESEEGMDLRRPLIEGLPASRRSTSSGETESELEMMTSTSPTQTAPGQGVLGPQILHHARSLPPTHLQRSKLQSPGEEEEGQGGGIKEGRAEGTDRKKKKERVTWGGVSGDSHHRKKLLHKARPGRSATLEVLEEGEDFDVHPANYSLFEEGYVQHQRVHTHSRRDTRSISPPGGGSGPQGEGRRFTRGSSNGASLTDSYSEDGRVIDGRYSISTQDVPSDFVRIEAPMGSNDSSTTQNLERCKKTVLNPFMYFLKFIGWRRIRASRHDLEVPRAVIVGNVVYPTVICLLLVYSCCAQLLSCFERTTPANPKLPNKTLNIDCQDDIVTSLILPDVLLVLAYLSGLYIFRYAEPEHLQRLIETVFLSYTGMQRFNQRLIWTLQSFLAGGFVWVVFSFCISVMRLFSLQLLDKDTTFEFLKDDDPSSISALENVLRFVFVLSALIGFIFFDFLYIAVVINFVSQCQLLIFYVESIIVKVQTKAYRLGDAIKEIRNTHEFLKVMNGKLASLTALCLFIFLQALAASLYALSQLDSNELGGGTILYLGVIVGVCNIAQWTFLSLVPVIQAARLTSACSRLRRLGLEIASRPYIYSDVPQLVLDSFSQYTNATRYRAKLASVPIYPSCVVGGIFLLGVVGVWVVFVWPVFTFAPWF